jgi:allantoinase
MSGSPKADPGLYGYWPYDTRPRIEWPGGARVALWIAPNIEFYEYAPPVNPHRKPWPRPLPDVLGYATRDYGNRVGHQRMMRVMDKFGLRGSVSLSTAVLEHHPEVIQMAAERNWEFFSHGIYNTRYTYGLDEAQEREMIEESMTLIRQPHRPAAATATWRRRCRIRMPPSTCSPKPAASTPATCSTTTSPRRCRRDRAGASSRFPIRWS